MFKFNFGENCIDSKHTDESTEENLVKWLESEEVLPQDYICKESIKINSVQCGDLVLKYVSDKDVIDSLTNDEKCQSSVLSAEQNHSDLVTALYEGGLKIWECTFDLLNYLNSQNIDFVGKNVLDLGCGAGLVGIFTNIKGSRTVFQDYNVEVIKFATIPNVGLNNLDVNKCKFFYGDWESFLNKHKCSEKFDYILTSETIYNVNNYRKIINIFEQLLKKSGIVYVAAKRHYFGVGGSISHFEEVLQREDIFSYSTCWQCLDGVQRAILKITLK